MDNLAISFNFLDVDTNLAVYYKEVWNTIIVDCRKFKNVVALEDKVAVSVEEFLQSEFNTELGYSITNFAGVDCYNTISFTFKNEEDKTVFVLRYL